MSFARTRLTMDCSAVLRSNTTMLFAVFGSAFGMQLYVTRGRTQGCAKDGS